MPYSSPPWNSIFRTAGRAKAVNSARRSEDARPYTVEHRPLGKIATIPWCEVRQCANKSPLRARCGQGAGATRPGALNTTAALRTRQPKHDWPSPKVADAGRRHFVDCYVNSTRLHRPLLRAAAHTACRRLVEKKRASGMPTRLARTESVRRAKRNIPVPRLCAEGTDPDALWPSCSSCKAGAALPCPDDEDVKDGAGEMFDPLSISLEHKEGSSGLIFENSRPVSTTCGNLRGQKMAEDSELSK